MWRWCSGLLGLVLGLAQLMLLGALLLHPHVSAFYRQYFITHERACWLPDDVAAQSRAMLVGQNVILPAALSRPEMCYMLMRGWTGQDGFAAWALAPQMALDLPIPPGAHIAVLSLSAMLAMPPLKMRVRVDGRVVPDVFVPAAPGLASLIVNVPQADTGDLIVEMNPRNGRNVYALGLTRVTWMN